MQKDDRVYIRHMLDLASAAIGKVSGKRRPDFDADDNLRLAVTHLIQSIGEAARQVSSGFQARYPQVPWLEIIAMRHKVVHDYLEVDYDIVWDVVTVDLPKLAGVLEPIISCEDT